MMEEKDFKKIKGYNGNILLKSANQDIEWTPLLVKEFIKCTNDPVYFIEKYMKIVNVNKGLTNFKLYPYQHEMIESFAENRFTVCCTARQAGKALDLNTEIPTIDGWTTIRDLKVGDYIFNKEGVIFNKEEVVFKSSQATIKSHSSSFKRQQLVSHLDNMRQKVQKSTKAIGDFIIESSSSRYFIT